MGRSRFRTALRHAKKDAVTPEDVPYLFRWLNTQDPAPSTSVETWTAFQQAISYRLKTEHHTGKTLGRMRQDTKRLAKIESVTKQLVEALSHGAPLDIAAAYAGIKPAELREWLALGHTRPRSVYAAFLTLIQEAIARCDVQDLQVVSKAAEAGEWKASIERLKLRGFGNQSAPDKKPVTVKVVNFNFAAPPPKITAQTIDLDTLEPVRELTHATEIGQESEDDLPEHQNADARGEISTKAGRGYRGVEESRGETSPESQEGEVNG